MVRYQSIPAATHHANAELDDTVKINKVVVVWRIAGSVMILLFVGLGVIATNTYRSDKSIIIIAGTPVSSTPAAASLLHSTTTTVAGVGGGDHCCALATGTWVGLSNSGDDDNSGPYETCYYNCDTAALKALVSSCYCWSKSYYDGDWKSCSPAGERMIERR